MIVIFKDTDGDSHVINFNNVKNFTVKKVKNAHIIKIKYMDGDIENWPVSDTDYLMVAKIFEAEITKQTTFRL